MQAIAKGGERKGGAPESERRGSRPRTGRCIAGPGLSARTALLVGLLAAGLLVADTRLDAQQRPPAIGAGRAVGQAAAGLLGTPVGFVAGGLGARWSATRLGASEDRASSVATVGGYVGAALATAAGPALAGAGPRATGSYWAALGGAAAGGIGSFLIARLNRAVDLGSVPRLVSTVIVVALPAAGATVVYDLSRRYRQ